MTARGFQKTVTTGQHASVSLRAAACYFCVVRDEATMERILKFQQIFADYNL